MREVYCRIRGVVQGVNFRSSAQEKARALGLVGWVRNRPDRTVEVLVQGDRAPLEVFCSWCAVGPEGADVHSTEVEWRAPSERCVDFGIRT